MIIKSVTVKNFRCAKKVFLECDRLTALVGANGSGKSTLLKALQVFFEPNPRLDTEDWFNRNSKEPIEISVTFMELKAVEKTKFADYLDGAELTVDRVLMLVDGRVQGKFYGTRMGVKEFPTDVGQAAGEIKSAYDRLLQSGCYPGLPDYSKKDQAFKALREWEQQNPSACTRIRDSGQFFGFSEVGLGYLGTNTKLIYVPAVHDAATDVTEGRNSVVKELVDVFVRNSLIGDAKIQELKAEIKQRYDEMVKKENLAGLIELQEKLNHTLGNYVSDAKVELHWQPMPAVELALPKTDVTLLEDGYLCSVGRSGHGLQRALVMTLLQHLATAPPESVTDGPAGKKDLDLILCIEEPEIYQHPTRQRHFAAVLQRLTVANSDSTRDVQVVYSTHSPMFVGLDRFDQVRLARKAQGDGNEPKHTTLTRTRMSDVASRLHELAGKPATLFTADSLLARLQTIMTPIVNEGFYANAVVLVEGDGDVAAIQGMADYLNVSLDAAGVAVIPVIGKNNLDRPALIFKALGIPTYLVWDSDIKNNKETKGTNIKTNRRLLRIAGEAEEDYPCGVRGSCAIFKDKLETTLKDEISADVFTSVVGSIKQEFGVSSTEECLKRPRLIKELLTKATANGAKAPTLEDIVGKIKLLGQVG